MSTRIGTVEALFRYPIKSMKGERLDAAQVGWHGLEGDRRLALRRVGDRGGFPWLTASKLPELILYEPRYEAPASAGLPTQVRTPDGRDLPLFGPELAGEVGTRHGSPVEMTHLDRGIFDEASLSIIASTTVEAIGRLAGQPADVRRFRPNILLASTRGEPFEEDEWVGGTLRFGDDADGPLVGVTNWDVRCAMVNFDPDSAQTTPDVLKAIVTARDNKAGVYATVIRRGRVAVGQPVYFDPATAVQACP